MPNPKVVLFSSLDAETTAQVTSQAPASLDVAVHPDSTPEDEKIRLVREADFVIIFVGRLTDRVLEACKNVKLIQQLGSGTGGMNFKLLQSMNVPVANNGFANAVSAAEQTIVLTLAVLRRIYPYAHAVKSGQWPRNVIIHPDTHTLDGKTVGVIGLEEFGRPLVKRLKGFGVRILGFEPYFTVTEGQADDMGARLVSLNHLLKESDVVTIDTYLSKKTRHLIGEREFRLMKPSAIIVNVSSGGLIDHAALYAALKERRLAGAGLDTASKEPPDPKDPLLQLDNVIVTPHIAGPTWETFALRGRNAFMNIQRVIQGKPPLWTLQPDD
ncbi:MAG: lactate dehydrogenase [SAR202 cluster bacterium]|nr:lactate dehydrogenase [SAR202 cluster bacterium]